MPEHVRALVVILAVAGVLFAAAKPAACALACSPHDYARRRNLWFALTLAAFLAHDYWLFILVAAALLLLALPREPNKLALFLLLLFAVPAIPGDVPGLGVVNYFFSIDYLRLLALALLLPAFLQLRRQPGTEPFGRSLPDKLLAAYLVLTFVLCLRANSVTDTLRGGVFYAFIDVFLPYYVASRALGTLQRYREALMAFALAAMVLGLLASVELVKSWLLYAPLEDALGARWGFGGYLSRGDSLRAQGSTGQPIALGYAMAVAMGLFLYLRRAVPSALVWSAGLAVLLAGLAASLSRGPWLGALVMLLAFGTLGPSAVRRYAKFGLLAALAAGAVHALPGGEKIVDLLPFVGTIDEGNVAYRQRLLDIAVPLIMENPLFGSYASLSSPAMEQLRTGLGIIDLVNTYVTVGLGTGLVGLTIFAGFFIAVAAGIFGCLRALPDPHAEVHLLGQALLATLLGILVIIFTVSSISVVPVIYWTLAGLGAGYVRMLAVAKAPRAAGLACI